MTRRPSTSRRPTSGPNDTTHRDQGGAKEEHEHSTSDHPDGAAGAGRRGLFTSRDAGAERGRRDRRRPRRRRPRRPRAEASAAASAAARQRAPLAPDPAEAVITGVEPSAEITFWTFFLSPTFDDYIKDTIARFEATYPGVKVNWEDHQGTFQDDLNNAFAAGIAPDVINLSVSEGWVSEYADKGLLLGLDSTVPKPVKDIYFPDLWKQQLVDGVNYQFPWYQGLNVELINKAHLRRRRGVSVDATSRRPSTACRPSARRSRTRPAPCATSA